MLAFFQVETIGKEYQERGFGYKYKDSLKVSMLGMVDNLIGITEAGYQTKKIKMFINIKTLKKFYNLAPVNARQYL